MMIENRTFTIDANSFIPRKVELLVLVLILLIGLHLRLGMVSSTKIDTPFRADARQYTAYAYNLRLHGVYSKNFSTATNKAVTPSPDAFRSPGYPIFLYPFTRIKNLDQFAVTVFYTHAILSTITLVIVYFLGRGLLGVLGAFAAVTLTAISPHLINLNLYLLTETLFTFFTMLMLSAFLFSMKYDQNSGWILSGIMLALAALIRPTIQFYIIFFIALVLIDGENKKKQKIVLLFAIPFFLVLSTWFIRNLLTLGFLSDPGLTINTLHHGMYPKFMYNGQPNSFGIPYRFDPNTAAIGASIRSVIEAITHRFQTHPMEHLVWYLSKPFYFFRWEMIQGTGTFIYPVIDSPYHSSRLFHFIDGLMHAIHPIIVGSSVLGAIIAWLPKNLFSMTGLQRFTARLLSLTYGYFILVHIAGAPFPRYSIPIRPITYILGIFPICIAAMVFRTRIQGHSTIIRQN
ncbi:glycosyltransferase family 39 protein [uncultured Desulfosarcina sp.]|uniref:glycosyltransferase family 39 protein n=1 Tax=uncultured Desulfosarcina sp. TaxID=218289 RepID=UPI0029C6D394|nr:glycosyltransferase family 39 protein [uncultured Desulfosarcina sp.]